MPEIGRSRCSEDAANAIKIDIVGESIFQAQSKMILVLKLTTDLEFANNIKIGMTHTTIRRTALGLSHVRQRYQNSG